MPDLADDQVGIPNGPTPQTHLISHLDGVIPKSVTATFDGTGAAKFLPVLIIAGKEGREVARIPAPEVAAGATAEVSWFPRGLRAAAAAAPSAPMVFADANTNFGGIPNVPAGGNRFASFDNVRSTDTSKIDWLSVVFPNDTLRFKAPAKGSALVFASCIWPAGTKIDCRISTAGNDLIHHDGFDSMSGYDKVGFVSQGTATLMDVCPLTFNVANGPVELQVNLSNSDAAASAPDQVGLACIFFPNVTTA